MSQKFKRILDQIIFPLRRKTTCSCPDMEKIAIVISIEALKVHINWNEVRNHQAGHAKNKYDARKEVLAKGNAFTDARIIFAICHMHCKVGIQLSKLCFIPEAWPVSRVES